ncbi:kinase-like protein [Thelephora ganbajun]|uniref:Kinase-like protein n=1 Tax=Thelephora ganbajun TaxID=370292 RepID=A0ACB6Z2Z2_THEGA|nr:kinase-like protein [Thelephora ganbajun]
MSSPNSPTLQQLHRLDASSPDFGDQLSNVLYGHEYQQCVQNLQGHDPVWLVDYLDKALDRLDPSGSASRKCLRELRNICGTRGILPTSYALSADPLEIGSYPLDSGGYGDVYLGVLGGSTVYVKRVRMYVAEGPQKVTKIFCKEAVMWKRLKHPNIVPLLGVTITPLQLISTWMPGGNLPEYIKTHPNADRLEFLSDVANGLCYLHSYNAIHGDIKGSNILVDDSGHARISDFGLATITKDVGSTQSTSYNHGLAPRWTAPEVLNEGTYSKAADVFSFAMLMIEVFTGAVPFSDSPSFMAVLALMQGKRPPRPTHPAVTEDLWKLIQRCWDHDPRPRPAISEVLRILLTSDPPVWKQLIGHPFSTDERISLLTSIFSDNNEIEMVRHLSRDDAQVFIDVIDEAPTADLQEVFALFIQDLWTPSSASEITADSALLRSDCDPRVFWWVCGRMEGPT